MNAKYSLKVEALSKHFARTLLFENISFSLSDGEVFAVTGWNGAGKSTLIRIIAGLVRPTSGRIEMAAGGKVATPESRRRFFGLAAPAFSLYEELTGFENLEFLFKVRGVPCRRSECLELMERVGLDGQRDKLCRDYSSGMKQRLKLIQAIAHHPPLLLLDEPGTNLDSHGLKILTDIISEQRQKGMTIIASNEKREVEYADRVINLSG
jgi:heme exporter protein A